MEIRTAGTNDVEPIRRVADASLRSSYGHAVDEDLLGNAVERWYEEDEIGTDITDPDTVFLVAVDEETIVGFAESYVVDRRERIGEIDWLHVHPDYRGKGVGSALLERVERELCDADVDSIEGRVLADNETGTAFYERGGYEHTGNRSVDVGNGTFEEWLYRKRLARGDHERETIHETDDGTTVYVTFERSERGSKAPFYVAYADKAHEDRYGYFCGNCEGTNVAIDTMDRMECLDCGNRRKPTRWDAAY